MKKIKILSIANDSKYNFNYYLFEKKKEIHKVLAPIFYDVFRLRWPLEDLDKKEKNYVKINIEKNEDKHENLSLSGMGKARIDIYYGRKKMYITIHCSPKLRIKFNNKLDEVTKK